MVMAARGVGCPLLVAAESSNAVSDNKSNLMKQKALVLDTNPVKGTRDFYPEDMRLRTWLFNHWRNVGQLYGFSEYDSPVLESETLYTRKAGEEVTQQLYNFVDKGQRSVSLRPEMTPSLARMVMAKKGALALPLKWFSIPQCWRYERMTRGRRREHFQWNMDIWGVDGVEAEAELLSAMVKFFENVGLTSADVGIKINSRLVIAEVLTSLGVPEEKFAATCVLVDKLEKVALEDIQEDLEKLGLARDVVERLTFILANKSIEAMEAALSPTSEAISQLRKLWVLAEAYGISDWIFFDASVVRGLAYYTGIVYEAFDRKGELRAIAGGGRYDKLLETFGGEPTPAAGFGFGDAVIVELLKERNILPSFESSGIDTVIFAMSDSLYPQVIQVASILRKAGQSVDVILDSNKKAKWVFKYGDRIGAQNVVIVGPDEWAKGEVSIKRLSEGTQVSTKVSELEAWTVSLKAKRSD
eukprot:CAMPEP_0172423838 /NCGR_PEP_ID=MMETSP1064-20121228/17768_1 /TAXON_ID=202472 /ORGANISM="Aulacoseira subarctica , Strain CCAP 1002/5" /LENGTH=470 /DNA_ID=CAMNT_0013165385 /DNA_START=177 /DNA_END=1588 /DNA_ORIENTATION=+